MMKMRKALKFLKKRLRHLRFRLWLMRQDYIFYSIGIQEGPPPSYYWRHSAEELEQERRAVLEAIDRLIKEDGARHEAGDFKSGGKGSHVDGANSVYSGSRAFALDGKGWIHFPARWKGSCFQKIGDAANRRK